MRASDKTQDTAVGQASAAAMPDPLAEDRSLPLVDELLAETIQRWQHPTDPYVDAVLRAALDLRRIGIRSPLTKPLVERVAVTYLGTAMDDQPDWFERAVAAAVQFRALESVGVLRASAVPQRGEQGRPNAREQILALIARKEATDPTAAAPLEKWEVLWAAFDAAFAQPDTTTPATPVFDAVASGQAVP